MNAAAAAVLLVLLLSGVGCLLISDDSEGASPSELDSVVYVFSYKKTSSTQLVVTEKSTSAYQNVDLVVFYTGDVTVTLDGVSEVHSLSGLNSFHFYFDVDTSHKLVVSFGSEFHTYEFKIRKNISLKELDEELVEYITIAKNDFDLQKALAAFFAFISTFVGVVVAYKVIRKKNANEVRSI